MPAAAPPSGGSCCSGRAAGHQLAQQPVQPVQRLRPGPGQLITPVGQQPQHRQALIMGQLPQPAGAQRRDGDGVRVGGVGLAAVAGVQDPDASGQLGRHIHHLLPLGQQPGRQRPPRPERTLHRPGPVRLLPHVPQQLPVTGLVHAEPARCQQDVG